MLLVEVAGLSEGMHAWLGFTAVLLCSLHEADCEIGGRIPLESSSQRQRKKSFLKHGRA
jgi:hypothetical protein